MSFLKCLFSIFVTNDGDVNQGDEMSREQFVSDGVSAIQSGVAQVYSDELGKAYDGGFGEGVQSVPTGGDPSKIYSQEELDQRIAETLAADEVIDQELLAAARAEAQLQIDSVSAALAEMRAKKEVAEGAVQGFKDKIDGLQSALDLLKSLITPAQPEPQPEEPAQE